jgi:hypothetical protein
MVVMGLATSTTSKAPELIGETVFDRMSRICSASRLAAGVVGVGREGVVGEGLFLQVAGGFSVGGRSAYGVVKVREIILSQIIPPQLPQLFPWSVSAQQAISSAGGLPADAED